MNIDVDVLRGDLQAHHKQRIQISRHDETVHLVEVESNGFVLYGAAVDKDKLHVPSGALDVDIPQDEARGKRHVRGRDRFPWPVGQDRQTCPYGQKMFFINMKDVRDTAFGIRARGDVDQIFVLMGQSKPRMVVKERVGD